MKLLNFIASALFLLVTANNSYSETVLYNEIFDGTRITQNPPSQIYWYNCHLDSDIVAEKGALTLLSKEVWLNVAYFTSGGAHKLNVGESLVFTFTFAAKALANKGSAFRMAILDSGGKRVTGDGYGVGNKLFPGYTGYGVAADLGYTSDTECSFVIRKAGAVEGLLSGGGYAPFGTPFPGAKLASDKSYIGSFSITNNGDSVALTYTINGVTQTTTENASKFVSFDTIAIQPVNQAETLKFTALNVKVVPKGAQ